MIALPLTRQSEAIAVAISISGSIQNKVRQAAFHLRQRGTCASTENRLGQISKGRASCRKPSAYGNGTGSWVGHPDSGGRLPSSRHLIALAALALTACVHQPLTRSCLTQKQYEQLKAAEPPKVHDKLTGKADEDVRPLAGSALELRSWGHALLDTLKICSTP